MPLKEIEVFDKAQTILVIGDIFIDACEDGVDEITTKEIMHFLGVPRKLIDDIDENVSYSITKLREVIKTKDSFVLYDAIEKLFDQTTL